MSQQEFYAVLKKGRAGGIFFAVPFDVEKVFGAKTQVKVKGTIDGTPYRSTIFPMGDGRYYMVVKKEIREAINKEVGQKVHVTMAIDTEQREVVIPEDLQAALEKNPGAKEIFVKFSYSHRKEYVEWIEDSKQPETRERRIKKAVDMILSRQNQKI